MSRHELTCRVIFLRADVICCWKHFGNVQILGWTCCDLELFHFVGFSTNGCRWLKASNI